MKGSIGKYRRRPSQPGPTRMEMFDILYGIAARDGREEALFGDDILLARPAFERMLIGEEFPFVYLEFPLMGAPGFDVFVTYGHLEAGAQFAPGAGYGRQDMFDWFARACEAGKHASVGIEADTSARRMDVAGVYLQQRKQTELVDPFLSSMGEGNRAAAYHALAGRLPKGWLASYVGLFPGRAGTPMRVGGYLSPGAQARCIDGPDNLRNCFRQIGFGSCSDEMLHQSVELMRIAPSVDFQFDLFPDGTLGDTFGLSLSFNEVAPHEMKQCLESGYGKRLFGLLQGWGLADDRWKLLADAGYARNVAYGRTEGRTDRLALCVRPNFAKVKYVSGSPALAKFYLMCAGKMIS